MITTLHGAAIGVACSVASGLLAWQIKGGTRKAHTCEMHSGLLASLETIKKDHKEDNAKMATAVMDMTEAMHKLDKSIGVMEERQKAQAEASLGFAEAMESFKLSVQIFSEVIKKCPIKSQSALLE